jgi:cytochrome c-type biogenesis protein CcmH
MSLARPAAIVAALACLAAAGDPDQRLPDRGKEARARALFQETRCLVCQGQSIDDSDSELAGDLRRIIRGQVATGRSDGAIRDFLVARYGDFVLFRPRFTAANALLWGAPFLAAGVGVVLFVRRRRHLAATDALSPEEEARLAALAKEASV